MIIDKLYYIGKPARILAIMISCIFLLVIVVLLFFSAYYTFCEDEINNRTISIIGMIALFVLGGYQIKDVTKTIKNHYSIGFRIVKHFKRKRSETQPIVGHILTREQTFVRNKAIDSSHKSGTVLHIYGLSKSGKTTSAFSAIEGIFVHADKNVNLFKRIVFIDCSAGVDDVLSLFNSNSDEWSSLKNSIIIIDNVEYLGPRFVKLSSGVFESIDNNIFVILIEDSETGKTIIKEGINKALQIGFKEPIPYVGRNNDTIWSYIDSMSSKEQRILFGIYFAICAQNYIKVIQISEITEMKPCLVKQLVRRLQKRKALFALFPYNKQYIHCNDRLTLSHLAEKYSTNTEYCQVLESCINGAHFDQEGRWLCFIQSNPNEIARINREDKLTKFNEALSKGRFKKLYRALKEAIRIMPEKESLFIYEYGVLNFYMGFHQKAFELYQRLLDISDDSEKAKTLIRIIECSHGSNSKEVTKQLYNYLLDLNDYSGYEIYSEYWTVHIRTERGVFDFDSILDICKRLENMDDADYLRIETTKRCYTDLLRCYHLLNIRPPVELERNFERFLKSINDGICEYYLNLYIEVGKLQYLDIPQINHQDYEDIHSIVRTADEHYEKAYNSEYTDWKSRLAMNLKRWELKMILVEGDIDQAIGAANEFLIHAQSNYVNVHEAYAETLLAKFKILQLLEIQKQNYFSVPSSYLEEIEGHLNRARTIYDKYKNHYGVYRVDFLKIMLDLYLATSPGEHMHKLEELINQNSSYSREYAIGKEMLKNSPNSIPPKILILWKIRSYPIILQ